jgi:hypothetical protein
MAINGAIDPARIKHDPRCAEPVEAQESIHISTSPMRTDSQINLLLSIGWRKIIIMLPVAEMGRRVSGAIIYPCNSWNRYP